MTDGCCCSPKPLSGLRKRNQSVANEPRAGNTSASLALSIAGLSCGGCARSIEKLLGNIAGVERADVVFGDDSDSRGTVRFDPFRVTEADVVAALERAGYHARVART